MGLWVLISSVAIGRGQGPGPGVPVDTGILAISDAEVCARSIPGEQGYPIGGLGPSISGKFGFGSHGGYGSVSANSASYNPCVVQCQSPTGLTWSAAKPWGSPCILHGEYRFCAANVCVLKNDTYLEYCIQNFQSANQLIALTPYMCTLECIDVVAGIVLKVTMRDGTPCSANVGTRYEAGFCYSGSCSVINIPYYRRAVPGYPDFARIPRTSG